MATTDVTQTTLTPVTFQNSLAYDVTVYDSFSPETETAADNNYFGQLTLLGTIKANSSGTVQPLRSSSAFIVEKAMDGKPLKRCIKLVFQESASFKVEQADEDAMTATFNFIDFTAKTPGDPLSTAFKAIVKGDPNDFLAAINSFFTQHPPYTACSFQSYMMAAAYTALNPPPAVQPANQPAAPPSYSLSKLVSLLGGTWPPALPDIDVEDFTCNTAYGVLSISATIDITHLPAASAQIAQNFASLFGNKKLQISVQLNYGLSAGISGTRLAIVLDTISIPVGGGNSLAITKPEISIDINPLFQFVVFSVSGVIPFNMLGKPFDASISMTIDNVEASIQAVVEGDDTSFPAPPALKGVHLDQFGVGIGVFFTPPGLALGLQGTFHIGDPGSPNVVQLDDDTFVLVCSVEDELPDPVYISFYIPAMNFNQVMEIFTNTQPALDVPVSFQDLSFKWAQNPMEPVTLPDGSLSQTGYGFSAAASVASFSFYGDLELDLTNGLTAHIEMAPLQLGNLFRLYGDGKGVTIKADQNGNPIRNNQIATTTALQQAIKSATDKVLVPPGGAVLEINTLTAPILHLNAMANVFDMEGIELEADINKDGIQFQVSMGGVLNGNMWCKLSDFHNFSGGFQFTMNRGISLPALGGVNFGSFTLNAAIDAHVLIATSVQAIQVAAGGSFTFASVQRSFGDFSIDMESNKIADLVEAVIQYIVHNAAEIFSDLTVDVSRWAATAVQGVLSLSSSVSDVMRQGFNQDAAGVAGVMRVAQFADAEVATGIKNTFSLDANGVAAAMQKGGYQADQVAGALKNVFALDQIASAVSTAFGLSADTVNTTLQQAGYAASDIANAFQSMGGQFASTAANVFHTITNPSNLNPLNW